VRETQRSFGTFLLPSIVFVPWLPYLVSRLGASSAATIATAILGVGGFVGGLALLRQGARWRAGVLALLMPLMLAGGACMHCGTRLWALSSPPAA